jgi:hypothetical protein
MHAMDGTAYFVKAGSYTRQMVYEINDRCLCFKTFFLRRCYRQNSAGVLVSLV